MTFKSFYSALFVFAISGGVYAQTLWVPSGSVGNISGGYVGIGTSAPNRELSVAGNVSIGSTGNYIMMGSSAYTGGGGYLQIQSTGSNGRDLNLKNYSNAEGWQTNLFIAGESRKVGIGTTAPREKLHVEGVVLAGDQISGATNGSLGFAIAYDQDNFMNTFGSQYSSAATSIGYSVKPKSGSVGYVSSVGNWAAPKGALEMTNELVFKNASGSTVAVDGDVSLAERFRINADGEVGIGVVNPLYKLDVGGTVRVLSSNPTLILKDSNHAYSSNGVVGYHSFQDSNGVEYGWIGDGSGGSNYLSLFAGTQHGVQLGAGGSGQLWISTSGNVGIGTSTPTHKLAVNGSIRAKEIIVDTGWADYVFADDYDLAPLSEVEAHIEEKGHLPDIPSASHVAANGVSVGEMQSLLLAKIEELTLHTIRQEKRIRFLEERSGAIFNPEDLK